MIFGNLPVKNLKASMRFFTELGREAWKPAMVEGPMYGGSFQDLDGHVWELMHMEQQ